MMSIHYIGLGLYGVSFIYYSKIDVLYGVLESVPDVNYEPGFFDGPIKRHTLVTSRLIADLMILLLFAVSFVIPQKYLEIIASLKVFQCIMISIITIILCRCTMVAETIEKLSKGSNLKEIPFEESIRGHYKALISHTLGMVSFVIGLYAVSIVSWINRFKLDQELSNGEMRMIIWFIWLFVMSGFFCSLADPIGRFKLIRRIRREKRKLKKEINYR